MSAELSQSGKITSHPSEKLTTKKAIIELDDIDPRVRNVLDAWLKFGTVFLVYRVATFLFFDKGSAGFFETDSLRMVILILVGFAIYYAIIEPALPEEFSVHPVINNVVNDTIMFGTVLVSSHVFESLISGSNMMNEQWLKTSGVILLAFAAYNVLLHPFIPFSSLNVETRPVVHDLAKYGVFLILLRALCGQNLADQNWILSVLFALFGFGVYHLATKKLIAVN